MSPVALLAGQVTLVTVGVVVAWVVAGRRLPAPWSAIGWGALTFPLSQVARFALVMPVTFLLTQVMGPNLGVVNTILLVVTSGLFEETARWIVLRHWAKRVRSWEGGVAFGLGHGGIEAILLFGIAALNGIVLLLTADTVRASVRGAAPDQLPAVDAQISALQALTVGSAAAGVYERILAIVVHIGLTLIVLRGVRTGAWQWWLTAVILHCAINGIVVAAAQLGGALAAESLLTVLALGLLWAALRGPVSRRTLTGEQRG